MERNISFSKLKVEIKARGLSIKEFTESIGKSPNSISMIIKGIAVPKTDTLAKICCKLKCYPSDIVTFNGYDVNKEFFSEDKRMPLPSEAVGELSYKPLWLFLADYLDEHKNKTANDLFDQIEPPRRQAGYEVPEGAWKKAVAARYGEGYVSERKNRTDYSKGLPAATRVKLRNDRPLNLSVIYEICKKLGCTIDFVMSYK